MSCDQDRVVISVAFDCVDQMVYWSDITGPAISKASLSGGDIIPVITTGNKTLPHVTPHVTPQGTLQGTPQITPQVTKHYHM